MEHTIRAPSEGIVDVVKYAVGESVAEKKMLVSIKAA